MGVQALPQGKPPPVSVAPGNKPPPTSATDQLVQLSGTPPEGVRDPTHSLGLHADLYSKPSEDTRKPWSDQETLLLLEVGHSNYSKI